MKHEEEAPRRVMYNKAPPHVDDIRYKGKTYSYYTLPETNSHFAPELHDRLGTPKGKETIVFHPHPFSGAKMLVFRAQ